MTASMAHLPLCCHSLHLARPGRTGASQVHWTPAATHTAQRCNTSAICGRTSPLHTSWSIAYSEYRVMEGADREWGL